MKRERINKIQLSDEALGTFQRIQLLHAKMMEMGLEEPMSLHDTRTSLSSTLGAQYKGVRRLYEALGYPDNSELDFEYYYKKWDRQDVANAVINRPVEATWSGDLNIVEVGKKEDESNLSKEWKKLDKELKVKKELRRIDKLDGIGQYSLLLFGFNDVKNAGGFKTQAPAKNVKLNYIKPISEGASEIIEWEKDSTNERFGLPKIYQVQLGQFSQDRNRNEITVSLQVHHSRILHVATGSLTSNVYGISRLKPIVNRLEDLEKLFGGDAEMFWRNARPGYHIKPEPGFDMSKKVQEKLEDQLTKYEHDLRRFLNAKGVDIKKLEQDISDPSKHIDIQIQAIAAQTGIAKRILVGSERGELSSAEDKDQWNTLITNRREEFVEPEIYRPFIDKCMEHGILTKADYIVTWEDLFAPSESQKAEVGKTRSETVKNIFANPITTEFINMDMISKFFMGFNKDQIDEFLQFSKDFMQQQAKIEDDSMEGVEQEIEEMNQLEQELNENGK